MSKISQHLPKNCFTLDKNFLPSNLARFYQCYGKILGQRINQSRDQIDRRSFISKKHNLPSEEIYHKISFNGYQGQHFDFYGHQGHKLTYFFGVKNIPSQVHKILQFYFTLENVDEDPSCLEGINFTFNQYLPKIEHTFPFHKDIPSNAERTIIYSVGAPALFELDNGVSVEMEHNSLITLKSVARWNLCHRITSKSNSLPRYSYVFGINNLDKINSDQEADQEVPRKF